MVRAYFVGTGEDFNSRVVSRLKLVKGFTGYKQDFAIAVDFQSKQWAEHIADCITDCITSWDPFEIEYYIGIRHFDLKQPFSYQLAELGSILDLVCLNLISQLASTNNLCSS